MKRIWAPARHAREGPGRRENGPPQDKRGSGDSSDDDKEELMDTIKPVGEKTRKRKKDTDETVTKKIKDNIDDDNLDLTSDNKPILSIGSTPPDMNCFTPMNYEFRFTALYYNLL
jgi:hypothetical protein